MKQSSRKLLLALFCGILLVACSKEKKDAPEDWGDERLFSEAKGEFQSGNYERAISLYGQLEARFPFGKYARQALLDTAYMQYKDEKFDEAIESAERFIKLYPQSRHLDYAWYLKALSNFNRGLTFSKRYAPTDESQRDPGSALRAFSDFSYLVKNYPNSAYREDSIQRMRYLRNRLARHEVHVANYYMRRGAFLAVANRASYVVRNYPNAVATPDALVLLAKSLKILELDGLSQDALRVLELNYPDHPGIREVRALVLE